MQGTPSLLGLPLYFFDLIFKIVRIRLCISDLLCLLGITFFLSIKVEQATTFGSTIRATHVDQYGLASLALFLRMCLVVFLPDVFQPAFRSAVYELFFVGNYIFAPPAV